MVGFGDGVYVFFLVRNPFVLLLLRSRNTSVLFSSLILLVLFEPRPVSSVVHSSPVGIISPSVGPRHLCPAGMYFRCLPPFLVWRLLLPACSCAIVTHSVGLDYSQV